MSTTEITAAPGVHDFTITRTFDAPRDLVYRAWADPRLLEQWMGPRGMSMHVQTWEIQTGGPWRFVNRDDKGTEYGFHGSFHGVASPDAGITWTFEFEGMPGHVAMDTYTLEEQDGRTLYTSVTVFQSVEDRDGMVASGMETGLSQSLDALEKLVTERV